MKVIKSLCAALFLLFGVTVLNFGLIHLAPGDPLDALAGPKATEHFLNQRAEALGLNDPLPLRYCRWLSNLLKGDLGSSYRDMTPVAPQIGQALKNSLRLMGPSLLVAASLALGTGWFCATHPKARRTKALKALTLLALGWPSFLLSLIFLWLFALKLRLLPPSGAETWRHALLPGLVLAIGTWGRLSRYCQAFFDQVLEGEPLFFSKARGASRAMLFCQSLQALAAPLVTLISLETPLLIGGAVITERIFRWPGMGTLLVHAVARRDYPVILGVYMVVALCVVGVNTLVDLLRPFLDPGVKR